MKSLSTSRVLVALGVLSCCMTVAKAQEAFTKFDPPDLRGESGMGSAAALSLSTDWSAVRHLSASNGSDGYESVEAPEGWRFTIGVPLWLPGIDGDLTVNGLTFSTSQNAADVVDQMDTHLNMAAAFHFEVQHDRLGFFADGMYVSVAGERDSGLGSNLEGELSGFIGELGLLYTIYTTSRQEPHRFPFRLDALGGVRVTSLKEEIKTENFGSVDQSETWWDPIIGLRGELGLARWFSIKARGDVGGFGVLDETSTFTWNANAAASFHLATWCNLDLGYRALSYDYDKGSGDNEFGIDAILHGPYIEVDFKF